MKSKKKKILKIRFKDVYDTVISELKHSNKYSNIELDIIDIELL